MCLVTKPTLKCHFVPGLPSGSFEIPIAQTLATLGPIILCVHLRLRWGLEQSCNFHRKLSNDMSHTTYMQGNRGDFGLLVVGSQITNLIPDLSFGHNLCLKCPNGSCKPILDIYVPRNFQWYKKFLNLLGFDPYKLLSKNLRVRRDSNSQSGNSLGSVRAYSLTLSYIPRNIRCDSWASLFGPHPCKPLPWSRTQG